jgi:hypothetical protein
VTPSSARLDPSLARQLGLSGMSGVFALLTLLGAAPLRAQAPGRETGPAEAAPVRLTQIAQASDEPAPASLSPASPDGNEAARRQVEQKLQLLDRMLADAPSLQRIQASGILAAQNQLAEARVHQAAGRDLLAKGDFSAARKALDDGLRHVTQARRLAPDAPARQAAARQRHEQVLASLERLLGAWRRRVESAVVTAAVVPPGTVPVIPPPAGPASPAAAANADRDAERQTLVQGLMARAAQLAEARRYEEATPLLLQAERHVLDGMNSVVAAGSTLDYSLRPANPAEELEGELARQQALGELLPLALANLRPKAETLALIERFQQTADTLRAQALQQRQAGDIAQALTHIRNATLYSQRALQAAGLVAPLPTGD